MQTLYLDAFSGISGDMFLGALLDLGLDFEQLKTELAKLHVHGYELTQQREAQSSIYGTSFDVQVAGGKDHGLWNITIISMKLGIIMIMKRVI